MDHGGVPQTAPSAREQVHLDGAAITGQGSNMEVPEISPQQVGSSLNDPETGPRNPGGFQPIPEGAENAPLPEGVDPGSFPSDGNDPSGRRPDALPGRAELIGTDTPQQQYDRANDASDVFDNFRPGGIGSDQTFEGDMNKVTNWGSDTGPQGEDGNQGGTEDSITYAEGEGDTESDEAPVDAEEKNKRAEEGEWLGDVPESSGGDDDPEGGTDPTERKIPAQVERSLTEPATPSPEDDDPDPDSPIPPRPYYDEAQSRLDTSNGQTSMGAPGVSVLPPDGGLDPGDPDVPPRPEFYEAQSRTDTSNGQTSVGTAGVSVLPPDGGLDPDDPDVPPRPEFIQSPEK